VTPCWDLVRQLQVTIYKASIHSLYFTWAWKMNYTYSIISFPRTTPAVFINFLLPFMQWMFLYNASWNISSFGGFKKLIVSFVTAKKDCCIDNKKNPRVSISLIGNSQHEARFSFSHSGVLLIKTRFLYFYVKWITNQRTVSPKQFTIWNSARNFISITIDIQEKAEALKLQ
jgi:hypothetical protein